MYLKDEPNEQFKSEVQQLKQLKKSNTQVKKRTYVLQIRRSNRNEHTNNKDNDFYRTNNVDSIGIQRKIKNMLEYWSDSFFGNILKLSKTFFLTLTSS